MKMGIRKFKRLDKLGSQVQEKPFLIGAPTNRAQRRKYRCVLRQEQIKDGDIDEGALFATIKEHYRS